MQVDFKYGWVCIQRHGIEFDSKGRTSGFTNKITDSNGRDEILPPVVRIVYHETLLEKIGKWIKGKVRL
jgi:hypothetical protein